MGCTALVIAACIPLAVAILYGAGKGFFYGCDEAPVAGVFPEGAFSMPKRIRNLFVNGAHLMLVALLLVSVLGWFPGGVAAGCVFVSSCSMLLLLTQMKRLLRTHFNRFSRIGYRWTVAAGLSATGLAMLTAGSGGLIWIAAAQFVLWLGFLGIYRLNTRNFTVFGDGPLRSDTWINPPWEALSPGCIVIMSGLMSKRLHVAVAHMELVLEKNKGSKRMLHTFTAYIEKGVIWHTLRSALKAQAQTGIYVALRPRQPWSTEKNDRAVDIAAAIFERNRQWLARELPRRQANFDRWFSDARCNKPVLRWFMPRFKEWFRIQYLPTGYDGISMKVGTRRKDQWTCQSAVTDVLHAVGEPIDRYETGFLGLGTGALDLPNPIEIIDDSAYELLTLRHKAVFEASIGICTV